MKASFGRPPVSRLIKPGDITKEFQEKATHLHGNFDGLKITNCLLGYLWKDCTNFATVVTRKSEEFLQNDFRNHKLSAFRA